MKAINLWECITAAEANTRREKDAYGPAVDESQVALLAKSARWNGQELTIEATATGWQLRVFSCYTDDGNFDHAIVIDIPKDYTQSVTVHDPGR